MRNITFIIILLSSLFAQHEIEGRWHLVGYEEAIMYQFVDTEPFADAGLRYSIYVDENGEFDDLGGDNIGGTPHPYSVAGDIITIDTHFGNILSYQMNYFCNGEVIEFTTIPEGNIHSILFRENYNYIDSDCGQMGDCCQAQEISTNECLGLGCYIPQCADNCSWEPMQCWSSTGYCWCVDESGIEIEGTSFPSWQGYPECDDFTEDCVEGDINNENPCNPMECWGGEWIEIIVDCAEWFGIPCDNGVYIPPYEDECCSQCVLLGDMNIDSNLNVLDIVYIVEIILSGAVYNIIADLNFDGNINVIDVVQLVDLILS